MPKTDRKLGVAVVGYGYWGPNIARNLAESSDFELMGLCELDKWRAEDFQKRHPGVPVETDFDRTLLDPEIECVAIVTPPHTHYELVRRALEADKHVLVEKPLAVSSGDAVALIELADSRGLVLMPGHTFVYSPSVTKVHDLIQEDVLGELYFVTSSRMNLGKYQRDGVVRDLAPHDLSILSYWLGEPPVQVAATGRSVFHEHVAETAFLTLSYGSGTKANVQISWLAPRKVREMVVVGSKRMVHYEDTAADESIRIYDRGLEFDQPPSNFGEYRLTYRTGDMVAPRIEAAEPLGLELRDFALAIREGIEPRSNCALGLQIVLALEALESSLQNRGQPVDVPAAADLMGAGVGTRRTPGVIVNGNGNGHHANGTGHNGNGHVTRPDGRANERRMSERRLGERRVVDADPPAGAERRLNERRVAERRMRDRRAVAESIGAPFSGAGAPGVP